MNERTLQSQQSITNIHVEEKIICFPHFVKNTHDAVRRTTAATIMGDSRTPETFPFSAEQMSH